jgi:hypothetical protein
MLYPTIIPYYLHLYLPEIFIYSLNDSYGATALEASQTSPSGNLLWDTAAETVNDSCHWSMQPSSDVPHRYVVEALCCAHGMRQAGQELGECYLSPSRSIIQ